MNFAVAIRNLKMTYGWAQKARQAVGSVLYLPSHDRQLSQRNCDIFMKFQNPRQQFFKYVKLIDLLLYSFLIGINYQTRLQCKIPANISYKNYSYTITDNNRDVIYHSANY